MASEIAQSFQQMLALAGAEGEAERAELLSLANLTQRFAPQLEAHPELIEYAKKISQVLRQPKLDEQAIREQGLDRQILIGGRTLPPPATLLAAPGSVEVFGAATDATRLRYTYPAANFRRAGGRPGPAHCATPRVCHRRSEREETTMGQRGQSDPRGCTRLDPHGTTGPGGTDHCDRADQSPPATRRPVSSGDAGHSPGNPGLDPIEETQVRSEWVATATLEADEKKGQQTGIPMEDHGTVLVDPEGPNNEYSGKPARSDDRSRKPVAFISYSKSNMAQRKRLESEPQDP